jgi:hypothetical protein
MPRPAKIVWFLIAAACLAGCDPPHEVVEKPTEPAAEVVERVATPFVDVPPVNIREDFKPSPALAAFLPMFDELSAKGFVPSLRRGSTGIGYTLETMLDIPENNSPKGDFMGMELKAWRDDGMDSGYAEKMNLFLKEPKWVDGLKSADRVRKYGYIDPNGRQALYSTVTNETNSHGLVLTLEEEASKLWMSFKGERIAFWDYGILSKRLKEKHTETAFVSAHVRGEGKNEEFHYFGVTWCREPSVESFLALMQEGDVFLELRMHLKESGSTRNHGSCFRIHKNRLKDLFKYSHQVRPANDVDPLR